MKNYSDMVKDVIKRRDQYDAKRKKRKKFVKGLSAGLAFLMIVGILIFMGMGEKNAGVVKAANLMIGIQRNPVEGTEALTEDSLILSNFAVKLLQTEMREGENLLISPLSVIEVLGMTINGADSSTRSQMEEVLGLEADELNRFLYSYQESLPQGDKMQLFQANSIWFQADEGIQVEEDFLQTCADYYDAEMYQVPFDDYFVEQVNEWVSERTEGVIPKVLDHASKESAVYLINALSFEARWGKAFPYTEIKKGEFLLEDGREITVTYLTDMEFRYLQDDRATGFMKSYSSHLGRRYEFVALLPREGINVEEYVMSLSGDDLQALIRDARNTAVLARIPKFDVTYDGELSGSLMAMGMTEAFSPKEADFGLMATVTGKKGKKVAKEEDNVFLSKVVHKTMLSLNERGTRAGVATDGEAGRSYDVPEDCQEVSLMRPFVYAIIDDQTGFPIFLGICQEPKLGEVQK